MSMLKIKKFLRHTNKDVYILAAPLVLGTSVMIIGVASYYVLAPTDPEKNAAVLQIERGIIPGQSLASRTIDDDLLESVARIDAKPALTDVQLVPIDTLINVPHPQTLVLVIKQAGVSHAYPLSVLDQHEVVNSTIAGTPILITFCAQCRTVSVFERKIGKQTLQFGNAGATYRDVRVVYDTVSYSLWDQIRGQALDGSKQGSELSLLPSQILTFAEWSKEAGEQYLLVRSTNESVGYTLADTSVSEFFSQNPDSRTSTYSGLDAANELVVGITVNGVTKAYPIKPLKSKIFFDNFGSAIVEISGNQSGHGVRVVRKSTRGQAPEPVSTVTTTWKSWTAMYPHSLRYQAVENTQ